MQKKARWKKFGKGVVWGENGSTGGLWRDSGGHFAYTGIEAFVIGGG